MKSALIAKLNSWLSHRSDPGRRSSVRKSRCTFRPRLEVLEDRTLPTTFTVTNLGDAGVGSGATGDLRYCLNQSNQTYGGNTIDFAAGLSGTIHLTQGFLLLWTTVTINGPGAGVITVSGNHASLVFGSGATSNSTISGLTIADGKGYEGGGISNAGIMHISNCIILDNQADYGGGAWNQSVLTVSNCTFSGNSANTIGGGLLSDGLNPYAPTSATIDSSTFTGNYSPNGGGGILNFGGYYYNPTTTMNVTSCTVTSNNAEVGGGILNDNAKMNVSNCTIYANHASVGGGIGGLYNDGTMTLHDSIVAGNSEGPYSDPSDVTGDLGSLGHNLIGDPYIGTSGLVASDILHANPRLAPLGNYGGPTQTMPLLPGSPGIDAGDNTNAPTTDQRGFARLVNGTIDIGAFESSGFTMSMVSGNGQLTAPGAAFANPLVVSVTAKNPLEPVAGGVVKFSAPASGAGTNPGVLTASIGTSGQASASETANSIDGAYTVVASANGANPTVNFSLTNRAIVITPSALTDATAGSIYSEMLTASGGDGPYTFAVTSGSLPPGFSLSSSGLLSGWNTTAATYSFTVTATDANNFSGSKSYSLKIDPAATSNFAVSSFPSPTTAGVAGNFTVTAEDAFGNLTPGYSGTVHFTSSDGNSTLPADSTLTNGTGTFSATLTTAGNQTITATDTNSSSITGTSNSIAVSAAAATHFLLSAPSSATEGIIFKYTVTAQDPFGNTDTSYGGTVHFTSSDVAASLPPNSTLTNGIGTFSAGLEEGNQTITGADTVTSSITGTSTTFNVADAALTAGALTPPNATVGVPFTNATIFHFTDANPNATPGDFSAKVTLGDGNSVTLTSTPSANGQIVANGGGFDVQLTYSYATAFAGQTFAVNVTDVGGQTTSASTNNFSVPFVDNFGVNGPLSAAWTVQVGSLQVNSDLAHGTAQLDVATVNNFMAPNTAVQADVTLTGAGQYAGLVSHYSGTGDTNMFWAGLVNASGQTWAQVWVNLNGTWGLWSNQYVGGVGGTLRLETAGSSLKLFLNNNLVGYANDTRLSGGTVGMRASAGAMIAHFSANVLTLTNNTLPFSEDFNTATNQQLSNSWLNQQGNFQVSGGVATGLGGLDVATVNGINNANAFVQADVNVPAGQAGGLVARYSGPLDGNMDWAGLVNLGGGTVQAQIWQNVNGAWSELFFQDYSSSGTGTLRFEAVGSSLKLFLNNSLLAWANDTLLTGGTVGIRSTAGVTFDNLSADALTLTNPGLPFNDSFNTATNQQLSNSWLNQAGNFQVSGSVATGLGSTDVATVDGVSTLNSTVQATVTVNAGQIAGLVSRYTGPGDSNMYWACVQGIGSNQAVAMIYVNTNGAWRQLPTVAIVSFSGTGTLKLVTNGNSLNLYVNNSMAPTLSIIDHSLLSPGTVGIRATVGATIDNFSATSP